MAKINGKNIQDLKKEDLRIIKTKKSLLSSFFKLLEEKTFEDITVNELCVAANIRRATFYKHYNDKYDFLSKIINMLREEFDNVIWKKDMPTTTKEYYVEYVRSLIHYLDSHYLAAEKVLQSSLKATVVNIIVKQNYEQTYARLTDSVASGMILPASISSVSLMLTGGITEILINWISDGRALSAEDISREIEALISCIIRT